MEGKKGRRARNKGREEMKESHGLPDGDVVIVTVLIAQHVATRDEREDERHSRAGR